MVRRTLPFFALLAPLLAEAAAPPLIPITGYLTDTTGAPIDGSETLHLKLYDGSGTLLWSENQSVDVDNGQFTAYLGDVTTVDLSTFRDNGSLSLGVAVGTGSEMTPRFELATAPFAGYAQYCDDADTVGGIDPADLLQVGDTLDWTDITGRPTGLDDGDDGAAYTNGAGLNLSANQFSVDQPTIETWAENVAFDTLLELQAQLDTVYMAKQSCTVNQVLMADSSGAFVCTDASTFGPNEATVDGYVANNGYVASSALGTAAYTASTAYATAAQGATADGALQRSGGTMTGALNGTSAVFSSSVRVGPDVAACTTANAGAMRYAGNNLEVCDGSLWAVPGTATLPSLPGLVVWVRADAGVVLNGTSVATWQDQSGGGNNFVQGTAPRQPLFVANGLNGRPILRMTATFQQTMTMARNIPAPATVIYVGRVASGPGNRCMSGLNNNWLLGYHGNSEGDYYFEGWNYDPAPNLTNNWYIWSGVMAGTYSAAFRSGYEVEAGANYRVAGVTGPNGLSLSGHLASSEFTNCDVAEVLVYNKALSAPNLRAVERYLANKYAL